MSASAIGHSGVLIVNRSTHHVLLIQFYEHVVNIVYLAPENGIAPRKLRVSFEQDRPAVVALVFNKYRLDLEERSDVLGIQYAGQIARSIAHQAIDARNTNEHREKHERTHTASVLPP